MWRVLLVVLLAGSILGAGPIPRPHRGRPPLCRIVSIVSAAGVVGMEGLSDLSDLSGWGRFGVRRVVALAYPSRPVRQCRAEREAPLKPRIAERGRAGPFVSRNPLKGLVGAVGLEPTAR